MTTAAKTSFGAELWLAPAGGVLAKVAELTTVSPPMGERGTIDATTHDSVAGAKEFLTEGTYDPGEISASGNYIARSPGDLALHTAFSAGAKQDWKIVVKTAAGQESWIGACFVTGYGPTDLKVEGLQQFDLALKCSGPITRAAVA